MSWNTPKTDWAVPDIVQTTDMNEIGENIAVLHKGNEQNSIYNIVSANALALPNDTDQLFIVTGNTSITFISDRPIGNHITLSFDISSTIYLYHDSVSTPPSGYSPILNSDLLGLEINLYDAIQLVYVGAYWAPLLIRNA